jgi:hypothetical protein
VLERSRPIMPTRGVWPRSTSTGQADRQQFHPVLPTVYAILGPAGRRPDQLPHKGADAHPRPAARPAAGQRRRRTSAEIEPLVHGRSAPRRCTTADRSSPVRDMDPDNPAVIGGLAGDDRGSRPTRRDLLDSLPRAVKHPRPAPGSAGGGGSAGGRRFCRGSQAADRRS